MTSSNSSGQIDLGKPLGSPKKPKRAGLLTLLLVLGTILVWSAEARTWLRCVRGDNTISKCLRLTFAERCIIAARKDQSCADDLRFTGTISQRAPILCKVAGSKAFDTGHNQQERQVQQSSTPFF